MEQNSKIAVHVTTPSGKVNVGGEFIVLADETLGQYCTDSLLDFIKYIKEAASKAVFVCDQRVVAFESTKPKHNTEPLARCAILKTSILNFLLKQNGEKLNLGCFDDLLRITGQYIKGEESLKLLDFLNNVQIKKVKTVHRQRDDRGNFAYTVKSEGGSEDFVFPKQVTFRVPLIRHIPEEVDLDFDFFFTWNEQEEAVAFCFRLKNINITEIVEDEIHDIISKTPDKAEIKYLLGGFAVIQKTNNWSLKEKPIFIKEK